MNEGVGEVLPAWAQGQDGNDLGSHVHVQPPPELAAGVVQSGLQIIQLNVPWAQSAEQVRVDALGVPA